MRHTKLVFALLGFAATLVAADPTVGTWKLNTAKSKYSPGPTPTSATITYEDTADGIKRTGENVLPDGTKTSFEYTAKYDGKDYPVTGSDTIDMIALKRINDRTTEATLKKSGKVVSTAKTGSVQRRQNADPNDNRHERKGPEDEERRGLR